MKTLAQLSKIMMISAVLTLAGFTMSTAQMGCVALFQHSGTPGTTAVAFYDSSFASSGSISSWSWDFGDGSTSTLQNPVHTYNAPGTYLVCLTITSTNPQCTSTTCDTINVGGIITNCNAAFTAMQNSGNLSVNFTNQSTGTYSYMFWDFGDGSTSTAANPVHTYGNQGTYNVCLTIQDTATNCFDTYCQSITVTGSSSCSGSYTFTYGNPGTVNFSGSSTGMGTPVSWFWNFGDGNSATGQNVSHTYANSGVYNACLIITTANPQCVYTYCDSVSVQTGGGSNCSANFTYSQNSTFPVISFNNTSTGNYTSILWDFGDGNTSTSANPNHTYANPGTYLVCLTVSGSPATGCSSTWCDSVVVNGTGTGACQANFTVSPDSTNTIFQFNNNSTGTNLTYFWDFGDGNTSTQQNPVHTYAQSGIYGACLTVTGGGCISVMCDTIYVGSTNSCVAYFTWNANVLAGITFNSYSAGAQLTYLWDFGDGSTSTQQNPVHIYANAGTYTACLTITDVQTGCTDTFCSVVTVQTGSGICSSNYALYPDSTLAHTYWAYNLATGVAPLTYLWSWGDSTFSNTAYPSHTYAGPGLYQICLTVTDATGCTSTTCYNWQLLRLSGNAPVTINVVPGTTGLNDIADGGTVDVFPNPAYGTLNINLTNNTGETAVIELYDMQGRKAADLGTREERSIRLEADIDQVPSGMYILRVSAGDWYHHTKVMIK